MIVRGVLVTLRQCSLWAGVVTGTSQRWGARAGSLLEGRAGFELWRAEGTGHCSVGSGTEQRQRYEK